ncbi:MAG: hypothetical protein WDM94_03755 [Bauldia sp.]
MATNVKPESAKNIKFVGYSDQGGRPDGVQVMVNKGYAFVSQAFSGGWSLIDVRNPREPKAAGFFPCHPASWALHLQAFGDLLLVVEEFNFYSVFNSEKSYYGKSADDITSSDYGKRGEDYSAGLRVYDISNPAEPRAIGFMEVEGLGLHRVWWVGDRYAYASAFLDGYTDHILIVIDMKDPTRPVEAGRWWMPGMWKAGGEKPTWKGRTALHHALVSGDTAYSSWRDGGVVLLDIKNRAKPEMISHTNWSPPFAGGTHSALPLVDRGLLVVADEAVQDIDVEPMKHTWILDIREPKNPVTIATVPIPSDQDYVAKGGHFGPHNLWENRPDAYQSSEIIFATYQNAGVRVFDIRNQFRPEEIAYFVPPPPARSMDPRPGTSKAILHTCDVYVQPNGLMYITDFNAGLYILEWDGGA